ncbi:MAG: hypothetical protein ABSC05_12030 [Candidatus Solibacter sp.]|jgi:hypothetical protein
MNAKLLISGLIVAGSLLAQPPGGPRGRGPMGFGGPGRGPGPMATVTGAPYSAVEVRTSQQVLTAGNVIQRQQQTNIYRDSQGRVRRETTRTTPDGQTLTRVTISDPVAGVVQELDAKNKTAFSRPARFPSQAQTAGAPRRPAAQADANVKRETLAAQTMNGIIASGSRVTRTIPAGTIGNSQAIETVRETWMADDLKVPLMTKVSDPRTGTSTMQLTNINRSQPDPSLFQIPADYTVKKAPGGPGGGRGRGPGPAPKQ